MSDPHETREALDTLDAAMAMVGVFACAVMAAMMLAVIAAWWFR